MRCWLSWPAFAVEEMPDRTVERHRGQVRPAPVPEEEGLVVPDRDR
jgi:hypothetical protein